MPPVRKMAGRPVSAVKKTDAPRLEDFVNEVKARAFDIYLKRTEKGQAGDEIGDWVNAEKQIKAKYDIK